MFAMLFLSCIKKVSLSFRGGRERISVRLPGALGPFIDRPIQPVGELLLREIRVPLLQLFEGNLVRPHQKLRQLQNEIVEKESRLLRESGVRRRGRSGACPASPVRRSNAPERAERVVAFRLARAGRVSTLLLQSVPRSRL